MRISRALLTIDLGATVVWLAFLLLLCLFLFTGQVKPEATVTDWLVVFLTLSLGTYALQAILEGKKDRRKDLIEKELSEVYSPLCEILRKGRWDNKDGWRNAALAARLNKDGPRLCVLYHQEFARLREIVERFGHYIDPKQLESLTKIIDDYDPWQPDITDLIHKPEEQTMYRFKNIETDALDKYLRNRREELSQELKKLTVKA